MAKYRDSWAERILLVEYLMRKRLGDTTNINQLYERIKQNLIESGDVLVKIK